MIGINFLLRCNFDLKKLPLNVSTGFTALDYVSGSVWTLRRFKS